MTKRKPKEWVFWCGFSDGELFIESIADPYCEGIAKVRTGNFYLSKREAMKRFEDVRKVRLTIVEDGK